MEAVLARYIPEAAIQPVVLLIKEHKIFLKIVNQRVTRHGDYRKLSNGQHRITVNASGNKYRFFITLIHEIAHLQAIEIYGRGIKPHGVEWKFTFQQLMLPFLHPQVFPQEMLPVLAQHFKNPKASSDTDTRLALALKQYDSSNGKQLLVDLDVGQRFRVHNGRVFTKGITHRKRIEAVEMGTDRTYLFNPLAEVYVES